MAAHVHIIGAGLAGLITACKIKEADIYEASARAEQHKALLRFRTRKVSELTEIPFKEVTVHKEIWSNGYTTSRCTIAMANLYAAKVSSIVSGRSVWNLDTCTRYIAPHDFYDQLCDRLASRIAWNSALAPGDITRGNHKKFINTSPLPVIMDVCGLERSQFSFLKKTIRVERYLLPEDTDVYQTIYFPERGLRIFRASITGNVLIVESMTDIMLHQYDETVLLREAFGLGDYYLQPLDAVDQRYGKIVDLPRDQKEAIMYELAREFNVFSIGRFATWRNILLDDVINDINVVERLMAASTYGRDLLLANRS
jgi:hypothetical protein